MGNRASSDIASARFVEGPGHFDKYAKWQCLAPRDAAHLLEAVRAQRADGERATRLDDFLASSGFLGRLEGHLWPLLEPQFEAVRPPRARRLALLQAVALFYRAGEHDAESAHTDNADVTFNLCLLPGEAGGAVHLLPGNRSFGVALAYLSMAPGEALIHAGCLPHEVQPVTAGERVHLIVQFDWATEGGTPVLVEERAAARERLGLRRGAPVGSVSPGLLAGALPPRLEVEAAAAFLDEPSLANLCEASRACYAAFTAPALWARWHPDGRDALAAERFDAARERLGERFAVLRRATTGFIPHDWHRRTTGILRPGDMAFGVAEGSSDIDDEEEEEEEEVIELDADDPQVAEMMRRFGGS